MKSAINFKLPSQNQLDTWQMKQFKALGYMAYGWMPTICKKFNDDVLNSDGWIKACQSKDVELVTKAISNLDNAPFNNSWVGTSKVLHFINPNVVPIWDSRVRNTIVHTGLHNARTLYTNNKDAFIAYLKHTHELLECRSIDSLKTFLDEKYKQNHSRIRVIELIYFNAD